jgi:hypothetical protein
MSDIKETQLNLKLRSDLLTAHADFEKFEARMRKLFDKRMDDLQAECRAEAQKFQGGKWMDFWQDFDELEWWSRYGDSAMENTPFMESVARNLNNWILNDDNINLKSK